MLRILVGAHFTPSGEIADAYRGIDSLLPRQTWWRREARRGARDAEEYVHLRPA